MPYTASRLMGEVVAIAAVTAREVNTERVVDQVHSSMHVLRTTQISFFSHNTYEKGFFRYFPFLR